MNDRKNDPDEDSFWDISRLLPKSSPRPVSRPFATQRPVQPVYTREHAKEPAENAGQRILTAVADEALSEQYCPDWNPFFDRVSIYRSVHPYPYFAGFRRDGRPMLSKEGSKAPFVPFYATVPQYHLLDDQQIRWYLYWRSCVRGGIYPDTGESYFWLYVYEVLNFSDTIPPQQGVQILCRLWSAYGKHFPSIHKYMSMHLFSYCLLHRTAPPLQLLREVPHTATLGFAVPEFYLACRQACEGNDQLIALIDLFSDYRWQASRLFDGESRNERIGLMLAVLRHVVERLLEDRRSDTSEPTVYSHTPFLGAVCCEENKCRIELSYRPASHAETWRKQITAAVKYTENKIRQLNSYRSRLTVNAADVPFREMLDAFFEPHFRLQQQQKEAERTTMTRPAYESRYDACDSVLDAGAAARIEQDSWINAERLTVLPWQPEPGTEDSAADPTPADRIPASGQEQTDGFVRQNSSVDATRRSRSGDETAKRYAGALLSGDRLAVTALLQQCGLPESALAEAVNAALIETVGDTVIEEDASGYHVVEEYSEELKSWMLVC